MDFNKNELENSSTINLQFDKRGGLLPVVVQEAVSGDILMIAYVNSEALEYSIKHGEAAFWSTSRNELWVKGTTSGNRMNLLEVLVDCDQDALVYVVSLTSRGICHTKNKAGNYRKSCFYRRLNTESMKLSFINNEE